MNKKNVSNTHQNPSPNFSSSFPPSYFFLHFSSLLSSLCVKTEAHTFIVSEKFYGWQKRGRERVSRWGGLVVRASYIIEREDVVFEVELARSEKFNEI